MSSVLLEQPAPAVRVEILAAAVGTDERADPGARSAILLYALESMSAVRAGQGAAVKLGVCMKFRRGVSCGRGTKGAMGSGHLLLRLKY